MIIVIGELEKEKNTMLNKNFGETREMPNKKAKASKQRRRKLNDSLKKLGRTAHQVKKIRDRSRYVSY